MTYPVDWNEFEDGEGSFLFYNPNEWTGNFRISAFKGNATYGKDLSLIHIYLTLMLRAVMK